jgi:phosphatidyl-myo-inositol dimannoside synthase
VLLVLVEVRADAGGIENVGCSLVRLLRDKQSEHVLDFRVASLRGPATETDLRNADQWAGSRLTHFDGRRGAFGLSVLWQMVAWADVVIFIHAGLSSLQNVLPRWLRPTSITWIHGVESWSRPTRRRRLGLARSDYLVANTAFTVRKALSANPWLPQPRVCHLGIADADVEGADDAAAQLGFSPGRHDILIVGRMAKGEGRKGHQQLISAMGDVRRVVPDARLIVVGTGDDVAFYQALARETAVSGSVIFTGHVNAAVLAALYCRCGMFAMPSRQEGFGLVYLEAMRAGLPCISSVWDGGQEIVVDGETGYHVDPDDREALTATLTRLLLDDGLRSGLGNRGRARFHESFTERHFHDRFWDALSAALAG